ncbi:MAG: hypothetical protein ACYTEU_13000 [Planctomycetota bacterium]
MRKRCPSRRRQDACVPLEDWPYSTCHRFCQEGLYEDFDWDLFEADDDESMEYVKWE